MPKRNAFYAQSGGVTAVINARPAGHRDRAQAQNRIGRLYAGRNGILGALDEDLTDTTRESAAAIAGLRSTPGGAFGSARYKLKGLEENRAEYERLIEVFRAHDIGYFFYIGGGDSADTCLKVSQLGERLGYPVTAIHVPTTVDNDLPFTDNCPGSARRQVRRRIHPRSRPDVAPWPALDPCSFSRSWADMPAGSQPPRAPRAKARRAPHIILFPEVPSTRRLPERVTNASAATSIACGGERGGPLR